MAMLALVLCAWPALAQTPPPAKVGELIEILSDPGVRAWLDAQSNADGPAAPA